MADVSEWLRLVQEQPLLGTAGIAGTGAISLGAYWLFRNDDGKPVSTLTRVVFGLLATVAVVTTAALLLQHFKPN